MLRPQKKIGEILVDRGYISQAQLAQALNDQKASGKFLGKLLVDRGLITERQLTLALGEQFGLAIVEIKNEQLNMELAQKFSSSLVIEHKCFPLSEDETTITVAIVDPLDAEALAELEEQARPRTINLVLAYESDLTQVIEEFRKHLNRNLQNLLKRKRPDTGA